MFCLEISWVIFLIAELSFQFWHLMSGLILRGSAFYYQGDYWLDINEIAVDIGYVFLILCWLLNV